MIHELKVVENNLAAGPSCHPVSSKILEKYEPKHDA